MQRSCGGAAALFNSAQGHFRHWSVCCPLPFGLFVSECELPSVFARQARWDRTSARASALPSCGTVRSAQSLSCRQNEAVCRTLATAAAAAAARPPIHHPPHPPPLPSLARPTPTQLRTRMSAKELS